MAYLQNLHTHTVYCDGIHTPEEMVRFAMEKGFDSIGFSGHAYTWHNPYANATPENTEKYKAEVTALKAKYADRLKIFLGLEMDLHSGADQTGYDYLIGSVHYLKQGDAYIPIDRSRADILQGVIDDWFGGDAMTFVKAYYETVASLPRHGKFDIIGHFDLITKNLDAYPLFDDTSDAYIRCAVEAMEALRPHIPVFEVNTGAMARGYRKVPYPTETLLKYFYDLGFGAVITSDCHDGTKLDLGREDARQLLLRCGFKEQYILTDSGFEPIPL